MKKLILVSLSTVCMVGVANAGLYQFTTSSHDMGDQFAYAWNLSLPTPLAPGEIVTGAVLQLENLADAGFGPLDTLYIRLLNDHVGGAAWVTAGRDTDPWYSTSSPPVANGVGDFFGGDPASRPLIAQWTPSNSSPVTLSYDLVALGLGETLTSFLGGSPAGQFAFGFDPDCYWTVNRLRFTLTTTPVPAAVLLGFLGLGAAGLKLRRFA